MPPRTHSEWGYMSPSLLAVDPLGNVREHCAVITALSARTQPECLDCLTKEEATTMKP